MSRSPCFECSLALQLLSSTFLLLQILLQRHIIRCFSFDHPINPSVARGAQAHGGKPFTDLTAKTNQYSVDYLTQSL